MSPDEAQIAAAKSAGSSSGHAALANAIRFLAIDAVQAANSGHPGMPMGMADVATVLFARHMKFDPTDPEWPDRDRFVLSAGHGSMLLYALLHLTGYPDMTIEEIKNFRQLGSKTAGHPEFGLATGIEVTTGPLGQGLAMAVGLALGERHMNAQYGDPLVDHMTYVIAGDGCLMEGVSHEAIGFAGHLGLGKLIVFWDDNGITIDGPTSLSESMDQQARFAAAGWHVQAVDGHDPEAVDAAIVAAKSDARPSMIACKTVIGYGAPTKAGTSATHGAALGEDEVAGTREALNWPHEPFVVPDEILAAWRTVGVQGAPARQSWSDRLAASEGPQRLAFEVAIDGEIPASCVAALTEYRKGLSADQPKRATRQSSGETLGRLASQLSNLIGGSADLTGSNNTIAPGLDSLTSENYGGRYVYYGIREFGMAAVMNGLARHGGAIPYGGTFLVFADYMRPAIRLSALMEQRVIYVMTHDSIGLGEDGPTHQPVETLASLRAIPNLLVMRPADAVETAECWEVALRQSATPSVLSLTRQGLPTVRTTHTDENLSARGGYVLVEAEGSRDVTLIATGSEVSLALEAHSALQDDGVSAAVVSMPSWELFDQQDRAYRQSVLGEAGRRIAVEAAVEMGWGKYIGADGAFIGMKSFGASAPAGDIYQHFGITVEAVVAAAKQKN